MQTYWLSRVKGQCGGTGNDFNRSCGVIHIFRAGVAASCNKGDTPVHGRETGGYLSVLMIVQPVPPVWNWNWLVSA